MRPGNETKQLLCDLYERIPSYLTPPHCPVGVADNPPRWLHPHGHEESGPVDSVEPKNVLTYDVGGGRPEVGGAGIAGHRQVVSESIQPDVHLEDQRGIRSETYVNVKANGTSSTQ